MVDELDVKAALLGCRFYQFAHVIEFKGKWAMVPEDQLNTFSGKLYGAYRTREEALSKYVEHYSAKTDH